MRPGTAGLGPCSSAGILTTKTLRRGADHGDYRKRCGARPPIPGSGWRIIRCGCASLTVATCRLCLSPEIQTANDLRTIETTYPGPTGVQI